MNPHLDLSKLVGAASAPVALIIATSIFLSNIGGKYGMLAGIFRALSGEYREAEDRGNLRCRSLERQMVLYSGRLRQLMMATFWLNVSILSFILTVFFTGVGMIFPKMPIWTWVTGFFSFAGLLLLGVSVLIEMYENHQSKEALVLETAEFPDVLSSPEQEHAKRGFAQHAGGSQPRA